MKGTKDAPVDGFDGKPHQGPYVDDKSVTSKKGPGGIEELRPDSLKPAKHELTKEEWKKLGEEDDSVMNDPNRASPKGNTGTEGGMSQKEKERIEKEKSGTKPKKVPEPPKAAPPSPHGEQQQKQQSKEKGKTKGKGEKGEDGKPRIPGAQGLEVNDMTDTHTQTQTHTHTHTQTPPLQQHGSDSSTEAG